MSKNTRGMRGRLNLIVRVIVTTIMCNTYNKFVLMRVFFFNIYFVFVKSTCYFFSHIRVKCLSFLLYNYNVSSNALLLSTVSALGQNKKIDSALVY